jgi:hypothetical protein
LVEGHAEKLDKHDLGDGSKSGHRGSHGGAEKPHLRDRRIAHPVSSKSGQKAFRRLEGTFGNGDILAEHDDAWISFHLIGDGSGDRLIHAHSHGQCL